MSGKGSFAAKLRITPHEQTRLSYGRTLKLPSGQRVKLTARGELPTNLGQPSTLEALEIASIGLPGAGLVTGAGRLIGTEAAARVAPKIGELAARLLGKKGGEEVAARAVAKGAPKAAEQAASEARIAERAGEAERTASRARRVGRAARHPVKTATRGTTRRIATSKAGLAVGRAAERAGETRAGRVAVRGARVAKPVAKTASYPVRHPLKGSVALQVPAAVAAGDPKSLGHAFTGTGVAANLFGKLGTTAGEAAPGVAGNILKDAFNLPATALPSVYLPLAAAVHYAQTGDDSRLKSLLDQYKKAGLLPAIFRGDPQGALRAIEKHPLYSALEVSGAYAVAGRGAGEALRALPGKAGEVAATKRAPLEVYPGTEQKRSYSKNVLTKGVQVARERQAQARGREPNVATEKQARRYISGAKIEGHRRGGGGVIHRFIEEKELRRRENRTHALNTRHEARPRKHEGIAGEIAQGSIRPATFHADIRSRIAELDAEYAKGEMPKGDQVLNRRLVDDLRAAENATPKQIEALFEAARKFHADHGPVTAKAVERGLYDEGQVQRARYFPYAQRHMGATYGKPRLVAERLADLKRQSAAHRGRIARAKTPAAVREATATLKELRKERRMLARVPRQLLDAEGNALHSTQIERHMQANGVDPEHIGFLSHRTDLNTARSFNQRAHSRAQIGRQARTGEAFRRGAYDASYSAMAAQHALTQGIVDRATTWDDLIRERGVRQPGGGYWRTRDEAQAFADDPAHHGGRLPEHLSFVPVEISPWLSLRRELEAAREHGAGAEASPISPLVDRVDAGIEKSLTATKGRFVLMPEELVGELRNHFKSKEPFSREFQAVTQAFKYTVLPTSDKWLLGNLLDQSMRMVLSGVTPGHYIAGRRALAGLERESPEAAASLRRQALSGGNYAQRANYRVNESSSRLAAAAHNLARVPVIHQAAYLYNLYAKGVFAANGWLERQMETAGLGKALTDQVRENNNRWQSALLVQRKALDDLNKGLVNTDNQVAFARQVEDIFGRWRGNSPMARTLITSYAPFYLWARNATRFVALTLPAKHPIKTALLAAAETATEKERKKLGLDLFAKRPLPGFLQGSIPTGKGLLPAQYYTSFGTGGNIAQAGNFVLPQISGLTSTLSGFTWSGQQITNPDGTPVTDPRQLAALALNSQAEAMLPFLSIARRVQEGGGTPEPTSTALTPKVTEGSQPKGKSTLVGGVSRVYGLRSYPPSTLRYLRGLSHEQTIQVPVSSGGSSSGGGWWDSGSSSSSSGWWSK